MPRQYILLIRRHTTLAFSPVPLHFFLLHTVSLWGLIKQLNAVQGLFEPIITQKRAQIKHELQGNCCSSSLPPSLTTP